MTRDSPPPHPCLIRGCLPGTTVGRTPSPPNAVRLGGVCLTAPSPCTPTRLTSLGFLHWSSRGRLIQALLANHLNTAARCSDTLSSYSSLRHTFLSRRFKAPVTGSQPTPQARSMAPRVPNSPSGRVPLRRQVWLPCVHIPPTSRPTCPACLIQVPVKSL